MLCVASNPVPKILQLKSDLEEHSECDMTVEYYCKFSESM